MYYFTSSEYFRACCALILVFTISNIIRGVFEIFRALFHQVQYAAELTQFNQQSNQQQHKKLINMQSHKIMSVCIYLHPNILYTAYIAHIMISDVNTSNIYWLAHWRPRSPPQCFRTFRMFATLWTCKKVRGSIFIVTSHLSWYHLLYHPCYIVMYSSLLLWYSNKSHMSCKDAFDWLLYQYSRRLHSHWNVLFC